MTELAHRLDVDLTGALEIASLVRAPGVTIASAARLIDAYARAKAAEAAADATDRVGNRICAVIEAPLSRKDPIDA